MLNDGNARTQRTVALPSGTQVFVDGVGVQSWFYPNMHGDLVLQGDGSGPLRTTDPFGQSIDPVTGDIGTTTADDAVFDTTPGSADRGWVGQHAKMYEHTGSVATTEMGARQYVPALGRFLQVDPIEGGVDNDYNYPNDPINDWDLDGRFAIAIPIFAAVVLAAVVSIAAVAAVIAVGYLAYQAARAVPRLMVRSVILAGVGARVASYAISYHVKRFSHIWQAKKKDPNKKREHISNQRPSSLNKHQQGQARNSQKFSDKKRKRPGWIQK